MKKAKDKAASNLCQETICKPNDKNLRIISNTDESPDNIPKDEATSGSLQPDSKRTIQRKFGSPVCYADSREVREEFRDE